MADTHLLDEDEESGPPRGFFARWSHTPLYLRILGGLLLGVLTAVLLSPKAGTLSLPGGATLHLTLPIAGGPAFLTGLEIPAKLILRLLSALAPPLILFAIIHALMTARIQGRAAARVGGLLILNTLVAIVIGLGVANVVRPGTHAHLEPPATETLVPKSQDELAPRVLEIVTAQGLKPPPAPPNAVVQFLDNVPDSLLRPLVENNKTLGVIFVAVAFGIALRRFRTRKVDTIQDLVELGFDTLLVLLHWVIQLVPIGVFGIVASIIGAQGFQPFVALGSFIGAVLVALFLQTCWYLTRIKLGTWVCPGKLLAGTRDALVMAFSTGSSTATMPVTYACLKDRVGLREESASMGALVGSNFNNDGTALYEAMSALFISQMLGQSLSLWQQVLVVLTSVAASVGAAGIPEAGLVTMTMVFNAVGLPPKYIAILITVDWFLDRCRTTINVMGDMNVSCMLDGKQPQAPDPHGAQLPNVEPAEEELI